MTGMRIQRVGTKGVRHVGHVGQESAQEAHLDKQFLWNTCSHIGTKHSSWVKIVSRQILQSKSEDSDLHRDTGVTSDHW